MSYRKPQFALFGHFGSGNFGNDSTLLAILHNLRHVVPNAEFKCICSSPENFARVYKIKATYSRKVVFRPRRFLNPLALWVRKLFVGIPRESWRWLKGLKTLWRVDALVVPGTGLLTDAYGLYGWGPYDLFRWSVTAKLCRCKLLFVSVGAGPIYRRPGRFFVKRALSLAEYRSYRDMSSLRYLKDIGFRTEDDHVYPDLAFSLPRTVRSGDRQSNDGRRVVGLGLMLYAGRYSVRQPTNAIYRAYLEALVRFVDWLLAREYNVRLLIGDLTDVPVTQEFKLLLKDRLQSVDEDRIIDEPVGSVEDLLSQVASTDFVVGTRFHNVIFSLLLEKPVIAISFHHKCSSIMSQMGLSQYCQDINSLNADRLIEQFCRLRENSDCVRRAIKEKVAACQHELNQQYEIIFSQLCPRSQEVVSNAVKIRKGPTAVSNREGS